MGDLNKKHDDVSEDILQYSWNCLSPKTELYTISGETITVLFPGVWNFEEGPDFLAAKLSIDGKIVSGDIEVHRYLQDWIKHGHSSDSRYSNVILHVLGDITKTCPNTKHFKPSILTLILPDEFIKSNIPPKDIKKYPYGYCATKFSCYSDDELYSFFSEAGIKRFYEKSSLFTKEILESGVDKTLLKYFFDSCGYKNNREQFIKLFHSLFHYDINSLSLEELIAVIWGESGLLPESNDASLSFEMQEFINHNWEIWWKLRNCSDSSTIRWNLSGIRPYNTPCRRVAAVTMFISKYGVASFDFFLNEFQEAEIKDVCKVLQNALICKDKVWDKYSSPCHILKNGSAVLGKGRVLDLIVNVILPLIHAYYDINGSESFKQKTVEVWKIIPALQLNVVLKICTQRWLIPEERAKKVFSSAASQQGAIYIHRKFCERMQMDCAKCPIFRNG